MREAADDAGAPAPAAGDEPPRRFLQSLALRLVFLVIVFVTVPILIYQQFRAADLEKRELLLQSAQLQGELLARALASLLDDADGIIPADLSDRLAALAEGDARVKLLLRPRGVSGAYGFFYVAAAPPVTTASLERERQQLIEQGILGRLGMTCSGNTPLALRLPTGDEGEELITSITPLNTDFGCWAIVISQASEAYLGSSIDRQYWRTPEVRVAAMIYVAMAALVLLLFVSIWRSLRRFGRVARQIGSDAAGGASFAAQNTVPELHTVAQDFDRLVDTLRRSAESIRRAAEDNAHAFKTPIGVIRQAVEPLRRLAQPDARGRQAIDMIEQALSRLDVLVSCARQMDEVTADLHDVPVAEVGLAELLHRTLSGYAAVEAARRVHFRLAVRARPKVRASEDQLGTVIENVIDNAVRFSPVGGTVTITLDRSGAMADLSIADEGPGVHPDNLDRIFDRYFSEGSPAPPAGNGAGEGEPGGDGANGDGAGANGGGDGEPHFGIGLWIVRRHVEALGGRVHAENRPAGGLRVMLRLPRAV